MAVPPHSSRVNQQNVPSGGNTALTFAARVGRSRLRKEARECGCQRERCRCARRQRHRSGSPLRIRRSGGVHAQRGRRPRMRPRLGSRALHVAIMRRDENLGRLLLGNGADPNARLSNWTPTRRASADWHFHPALVGAAPFWLAARFSQPGIMRLLVEHGADPLFVHRVHYVAAAGSYGADGVTEATTALMAAVGMGGPDENACLYRSRPCRA